MRVAHIMNPNSLRLLCHVNNEMWFPWTRAIHNLSRVQIRRAWDERALMFAQRKLVLLHRAPRRDLAHVLLAPEIKLHEISGNKPPNKL